MERGATHSTRYTQSMPTKFKSKIMMNSISVVEQWIGVQSQVDDPLEPWSA